MKEIAENISITPIGRIIKQPVCQKLLQTSTFQSIQSRLYDDVLCDTSFPLLRDIILRSYYYTCDNAGLIRHPRRPGSAHHFVFCIEHSGNRFSVCSVDQLTGQVLASFVALDVDNRVSVYSL